MRGDRMLRHLLEEVELDRIFPLTAAEVIVTMSKGQWDDLLEAAYNQGFILVELDDKERAVWAYQRKVN